MDAPSAITVVEVINAKVEKVWEFWTEPKHIKNWFNASNDWHVPSLENDVRTGGKFKTVIAANNGSESFDFKGVYSNVQPLQKIEYELTDGRKVTVNFLSEDDSTRIVETFETESLHTPDVQKSGWQSILENFKKYVEANN